MEESSYVSWPLIAMGKFKNVQLDGELKTSGLQLLFFSPEMLTSATSVHSKPHLLLSVFN